MVTVTQLKLFEKPMLRIARRGRDGFCRGCENLLWDAETTNDIKMLTAYCMISEDVFYVGDAKEYNDAIQPQRCPLQECDVEIVREDCGNSRAARIFENKKKWAEYIGKENNSFNAYMQLKNSMLICN